MDALLATSTFLHDSCFSILYTIYHPCSNTMQPSFPPPLRLPSVRPIDMQRKNTQVDDHYPMLNLGSQDWDKVLLDAVGVPLVHQQSVHLVFTLISCIKPLARALLPSLIQLNHFPCLLYLGCIPPNCLAITRLEESSTQISERR
jgi:hypothetical protein